MDRPADFQLLPHRGVTPQQDAVIVPRRRLHGRYAYHRVPFSQLHDDVQRLSFDLKVRGVQRGSRIVLLVPFGYEFIAYVFAMLQTGGQMVLIDPGMGVRRALACLAEVQPDGFIATPRGHIVRWLYRRSFPRSRIHVVVGKNRPSTGGRKSHLSSVSTEPDSCWQPDDPAAIIFTSGSTGPAKGVEFTRGNFAAQIRQIQQEYSIMPGTMDLACFPLFGLFNATMGVTTVIPDMSPSRPATANPTRLTQIIRDLNIEQSFASPAVWHRMTDHCRQHSQTLPTLRRILVAGAPVSPRLLEDLSAITDRQCQIATPYGATEALPIATIDATEVLSQTADATRLGAGICVGRKFADIDWSIIPIADELLSPGSELGTVPPGQIGELLVSGPQVTRRYVTQVDANSLHKICTDGRIWHRMGDVGYLDNQQRFWFCGRKSQRLETEHGTMFTICCEAIANEHPAIHRSALVGLGPKGRQIPVMICEPWRNAWPRHTAAQSELRTKIHELLGRHDLTRLIRPEHILLHKRLPVDVRHNAKICREELVEWARKKL